MLVTGDPDGRIWSPWMVYIPLRGAEGIHNWFWAPGQDHGVYSAEELTGMYYQSVGRNCNLVIGEVITPEGLVPEHDLRVLEEFGKEIKRRFGTSLARTEGTGDEIRLDRSEEHTSELQSLMRISYAVFCLKNKKQ